MSKLKLAIVTPEEKIFDGEADRVMVRALTGDMAILPGHIDCAATLGKGHARIQVDGNVRHAYIQGGLIHVSENIVRILTTDFKWET